MLHGPALVLAWCVSLRIGVGKETVEVWYAEGE